MHFVFCILPFIAKVIEKKYMNYFLTKKIIGLTLCFRRNRAERLEQLVILRVPCLILTTYI